MGSKTLQKFLRFAIPALAATLLVGPLHADRLVTNDGRVLDVKKARKEPGGGYRLEFEYGTLLCPEEFVASVEIEGDMADYVPADDNERKKLEEGFVRYRGRWYSKPAYEAELSKEAARRRERVEELTAHNNFRDGWTKETKHFLIKTNTSPELLEYYCDLLETYYALMNKQVGIKPTPSLRRTKMKVNIYKSREEFQEITEVSPGVAGYFSFLEEALHFYHDYEEPAISNWVALHECTHLLTYLIEPQSWPRIWINEGVADFFGSSEILQDKKGNLEIIPGKVQVDRVLTVQQAIKDSRSGADDQESSSTPAGPSYVPLEKLFRIEKSNFTAFEYAHAWSFVYFLNNVKKYQSGFKRFFKDHYTLPKGVEYTWESFPNKAGTAKIISAMEVRRLLLKNLGVPDDDVPKLEKEWLDYIAGIEIDAPEARFKRAYRVVRSYLSEEFDQAAQDLNFAIAQGINDPRAYSARGVLTIMRSHSLTSSEAESDFRKSIELAPLTAAYHFQLAQQLAGSGFSTGMFSITMGGEDGLMELRGSDERIEEAKEHFGLASSLDPENEFYREVLEDFLQAYAKFKASDN